MSNMKNHLAEFEELKERIAIDDKIQGLQWCVRRELPWPLNLAVLMAYHAGVEWTLCWDELRAKE